MEEEEKGGDSVDFGHKSHSQDETQLPNFSSRLPHGPLTFQGGLYSRSIGWSSAQRDPG